MSNPFDNLTPEELARLQQQVALLPKRTSGGSAPGGNVSMQVIRANGNIETPENVSKLASFLKGMMK